MKVQGHDERRNEQGCSQTLNPPHVHYYSFRSPVALVISPTGRKSLYHVAKDRMTQERDIIPDAVHVVRHVRRPWPKTCLRNTRLAQSSGWAKPGPLALWKFVVKTRRPAEPPGAGWLVVFGLAVCWRCERRALIRPTRIRPHRAGRADGQAIHAKLGPRHKPLGRDTLRPKPRVVFANTVGAQRTFPNRILVATCRDGDSRCPYSC